MAVSILALMVLVGCMSQQGSRPVEAVIEPADGFDDAYPASALVFDPPATEYLPPLDLRRDVRQAGAYWGLQGPVTTFFYQRTDDRYGSYWLDGSSDENYRRRTVETKVGTSVR